MLIKLVLQCLRWQKRDNFRNFIPVDVSVDVKTKKILWISPEDFVRKALYLSQCRKWDLNPHEVTLVRF